MNTFRFWSRLGALLFLHLWGTLMGGSSAATQTLTWTSPAPGTVLRLNQAYPLAATASSGLPVTFRVASGPAEIRGGDVVATQPGRVTLVAEQAGSADWQSATFYQKFNLGRVQFERVGGLNKEQVGASSAVRVSGQLAYLGTWYRVHAVRVADPANPEVVTSVAVPSLARDIQLNGSLAYVAAGSLEIFDISSPGTLTPVGTLSIPAAEVRAVRVVGNFAYLACGLGGFCVADVSDRSLPRLISQTSETQWFANSLEVRDGFAYVTSFSEPVRIFDVADPLHPRPVASFGAKAENRLVVQDSLGFLADSWGQFQTWDLKDPLTPVRLGFVKFPYSHPIFIDPGMGMVRHSGFVYIANAGLGLRVLDVGDVLYPSFVGLLAETGQIKDLQVSGELFHLANWGGGYEIYRQNERIPQTIQFSPPPRVSLEELPWRLTATVSSGGPVSFEVLHGAAVIESGQLKSTTNGLVTILATQPGDAQFLPARAIQTIAVARSGQPLGWAVDRGFQLDTNVSGIVSSVVPLADGSILASGDQLWVPYASNTGGEVVHVSPEGDLDRDFPSWNRWAAQDGIPRSVGKLIARTPDEVVVMGHRFLIPPPQFFFESRLYRLRSDTPEWSLLGSILNQVQPFADPLGGIILAGQMPQLIPGTAGSTVLAHLSRLGPHNDWDPRIGLPSGMADQFSGRVHTLAQIHPFPDGSFLVAGSVLWPKYPGDYQANTEAFRLGADGSVRWRHTLDSPRWVTPVTFVADAPQDRIVLFPSREVLDAQTGRRVGTFPVPPEVVSATTTYFQASDGRLILSGTFTNYAGFRRRGLAAVLPDGSLDLSFDPGLGTTNGFLAIAEEADGSLLLGGEPGTFDGFAHRGLIRLIPRNPNYFPLTSPVFYLQPPQGPVYECTGPAEFVVIRAGVLTQTNRVRLQTEGGTATSGADFAPIDQELVFEPGERLKSVFLRVLSDRLVEPKESFRVRANFDSGVTVVGPAVVPIEIASFECGVSFSAVSPTNREAATTLGTLVWTQEYPPPGFTTRIRTRDLTALAGRDYVSQERSPVGYSGLLLPIWDNATYDGDRSFLVEAYDPETGQTINPDRSLVVTIADDDSLAGPGRGVAGTLNGIVPVRDGWLMLGEFSSMDGVPRPGLARVGFAGTIDSSFAPPAELANRVVCAVGTAEGGVLLGGNFLGVGILPSGGLVQLDVQGQIDPTFEFRLPPGATECSATNDPRSLLSESDGTWLVAGYFPRFFGCDASAKLLRLSANGQVVESWSVPAISSDGALVLLGNGNGDRYVQAGSSLFRVAEEGLVSVPATGLSTSAPVVVMPDGGVAGLRSGSQYPTLVRLDSEGAVQAETTHFAAAGDTWIGFQLHSLSVRSSDGRLLLSGIFYSATKPIYHLQTMTLALDPASLLTGQVAPAEVMNPLRLATLVSHPEGPVSGLQLLSYQQTEPKWWRLDSLGQTISDVAFRNLVIDSEGQVHFALSGQAPSGYTIETSDDLITWEPWFTSNEVNWGMAFHTPPLPVELMSRFFRVR